MNNVTRFIFSIILLVVLAGCGVVKTTPTSPPTGTPDLQMQATAVTVTETATVSPAVTETAEAPPVVVSPVVEERPFQLQEPNPLRVQPQLDEELAISEVITIDGGSLTAEAADGTRFMLTIPPNALLSDQLVTMTPLLGVEGQVLSGGFVAGVNLAPDGLQLFDAGILTIIPSRLLPEENVLSFAVHGSDKEVLLYPLLPDADADAATFAITHFSDYYLGEGDATDRQNQMMNPPSDPGDQFLQQMQLLISEERSASLQAEKGNPRFFELAESLARSYLYQALIPRIQMAESSDDFRFVCRVIAELMGFERTLYFLGITELWGDFDADEAMEKLLARQAELLLAHAETLCQNNSMVLGWRYVLRVARTQAVKGISYGVNLTDWQQRCGSLQLFFNSQSTHTALWPFAGDASRLVRDIVVEAVVTLRYDANKAAFVGEGPVTLAVLDANSMHGYSSDSGNRYCDLSWDPSGSTLKVEKLTINLNQTECDDDAKDQDPEKNPGLELTMDLGTPMENWSVDCSNLTYPISPEGGLRFHKPWVNFFRFRHKDYLAEGSMTYSEEIGTVFKDPTLMIFKEWEFSPDRSSAYVVIGELAPQINCDLCFRIEWDDHTEIVVR